VRHRGTGEALAGFTRALRADQFAVYDAVFASWFGGDAGDRREHPRRDHRPAPGVAAGFG